MGKKCSNGHPMDVNETRCKECEDRGQSYHIIVTNDRDNGSWSYARFYWHTQKYGTVDYFVEDPLKDPGNSQPVYRGKILPRRYLIEDSEIIYSDYYQRPDSLSDLEENGEDQYFVREYVPGRNIKRDLEDGKFNDATNFFVELLQRLLQSLEEIHSKGKVHGNIKPQNIIRRNSDQEPVFVDYNIGITSVYFDLTSRSDKIFNTLGFIAPEQLGGKICLASDIYSLGVTCIYLLTNTELSQLFDFDKGQWNWRDQLNFTISDKLSSILDEMIEPALDNRYENVQEVLDALNNNI